MTAYDLNGWVQFMKQREAAIFYKHVKMLGNANITFTRPFSYLQQVQQLRNKHSCHKNVLILCLCDHMQLSLPQLTFLLFSHFGRLFRKGLH